MKKYRLLKTFSIISIAVSLISHCGDKPTGPDSDAPGFPLSDATWWQYQYTQKTVFLSRHDSTIVRDTVVWTIGTNSTKNKILSIKTSSNKNTTFDTIGLIMKGNDIYAIGYKELAGLTPLFKVKAETDTTLLLPGAQTSEWVSGSGKYTVLKDTAVLWHGNNLTCRLISETHENKPVGILLLGTTGYLKKEYTPDTLISSSDTAVTFATLELDTFQIK